MRERKKKIHTGSIIWRSPFAWPTQISVDDGCHKSDVTLEEEEILTRSWPLKQLYRNSMQSSAPLARKRPLGENATQLIESWWHPRIVCRSVYFIVSGPKVQRADGSWGVGSGQGSHAQGECYVPCASWSMWFISSTVENTCKLLL